MPLSPQPPLGALRFLAALLLLLAHAPKSVLAQAPATGKPDVVALVRVLATPSEFVGTTISTYGYLLLQAYDLQSAHLCPSRADCENMTPAAVTLNDEAGIWRLAEKFDRTYVEVAGKMEFAPQGIGFVFTATKCRAWSDPGHPRHTLAWPPKRRAPRTTPKRPAVNSESAYEPGTPEAQAVLHAPRFPLISLSAVPQRHLGSLLVTVGYLQDHCHQARSSFCLYPNQEDAENELGDGLSLSGVAQPDLAGYYVTVFGVLRTTETRGPDQGTDKLTLEARGITFWSDPSHPIWNPERIH